MATRLTRGERKDRTKTDLVEAARAVFLRRGFHTASLDEIAEEAGYTKGAVYSSFGSKDELFLAVLDDLFRPRPRPGGRGGQLPGRRQVLARRERARAGVVAARARVPRARIAARAP